MYYTAAHYVALTNVSCTYILHEMRRCLNEYEKKKLKNQNKNDSMPILCVCCMNPFYLLDAAFLPHIIIVLYSMNAYEVSQL